MTGPKTGGRTQPSCDDLSFFRNSLFCAFVGVLLVLFWQRLYFLATLAIRSDPYSYTIVIPAISLAFVYWKRREIFSELRFGTVHAVLLLLAGAVLFGLHLYYTPALDPLNGLSLSILSFVALLIGSFALCYGSRAVRAAAFPLLLLLLMIPIPTFAIDRIIGALQNWSADWTAILYQAFGVPVHRIGLVFDLPGVSIRVAEECSGIRSTLALFITVLLAAQFSLKSGWRKLILCILVVPIAIAKNSIRIFTLSTLAVYVNKDFLYGHLHHNGGVLFFLLGLAVSIGLLQLLELWEQGTRRGSIHSESEPKRVLPQTSSFS